MPGGRWGSGPPPDWAYGRVTDPQRFAPLHDAALDLLAGLENRFQVERDGRHELDPELLAQQHSTRPTVKLTPMDPMAAPITVAFTSLPGLRVRFGHWVIEPYPACACDACDATCDGEARELADMVDHVVNGRFREAIRVPVLGASWLEWRAGHIDTSTRARRSRLAGAEARRMCAGRRRAYDWKPWPTR